ncbi:MAG: type 1 glutamine amidotransferase domain-containing protein [Pseudomonadota bacterium]
MPDIKSAKILILSTHGFEQSELEVPLEKLKAAGATVHVATLDGKAIKGWDKDNWGASVDADLKSDDVAYDDYDALVLPGGQINPDLLRVDKDAVALIRDFVQGNKIVAAICHAPWLLIEAGVVKGRDATSYHSIKTDMVNAGANWIDQDVVVSNGIITSRHPGDLEAFVSKIIEEVEEGEHQRPAA